jgi:hypothetical protein
MIAFIIPTKPRFALVDYGLRRLPRCLREDLDNHDRIRVDSIDNPPVMGIVADTELVTMWTD